MVKKYIQIGPFKYEHVRNINEDGDIGETNYESLTITISNDPKYNEQILQETLVHEVLHAILYTTPYHHFFDNEEEENFIRTVSPLLYQVILQIKDELFDTTQEKD